MNLAIYFQDALSANLYVVDTGLATAGTFASSNTTPAANLDSWDYLGSWSQVVDWHEFDDLPTATLQGTMTGNGCSISPDGTKIAIAAVNGSLRQYKVQVWDVGTVPDVASTIDAGLKQYLVNATKIQEYTEDAAVIGTESLAINLNDGAVTDLITQLTYGVVHLEVNNSGDVWWGEREQSSAIADEPCANDQEDPMIPILFFTVAEKSWSKYRVKQLLIGDSVPTTTGTFLTSASASPVNLSSNSATNANIGGADYCPGAFNPIQIDGIWDGARGRVIGRARPSGTVETAFDGDSCPATGSQEYPWWQGTATNLNSDNFSSLVRDGIFEEGSIVSKTNTGTNFFSTTADVPYVYQDQVPTEVFRDSEDSLLWDPGVYHSFLVGAGLEIHNVRRSANGIVGTTQRAADTTGDTAHLIYQDPAGNVSLLTVVDNLADTECGWWGISSGCYNNTQLYPAGALVGTDRQAVIDLNWQLRYATLVGSTLTISATIEEVSPDNPDDVDFDTFIREAVVGGGSTSLGGVGGTKTFFPTATINGA